VLVYWALLLMLTRLSAAEMPVVKACGHHDYPPWNWQSGGKIIGACAEAAETLFAKAGLKLDLSFVGPWSRCQYLIERGDVAVNICSFKNTERERYSEFVPTPMGINENAIFISNEHSLPYQTWADLHGKRLGLVKGVSLGTAFDRYIEKHAIVIKTSGYDLLFNMLLAGRIDAVPFGRYAGRTYIRTLGIADQIADLPTPVLEGKLYFSMSRLSPYLGKLAQVDALLQAPGHDAWMNSLLEHYANLYVSGHENSRPPLWIPGQTQNPESPKTPSQTK